MQIMTSITPFESLELTPRATEAEVKSAYRKLALKYHPDKAGSAGEDTTKEINCACEVIYQSKLWAEASSTTHASRPGAEKPPASQPGSKQPQTNVSQPQAQKQRPGSASSPRSCPNKPATGKPWPQSQKFKTRTPETSPERNDISKDSHQGSTAPCDDSKLNQSPGSPRYDPCDPRSAWRQSSKTGQGGNSRSAQKEPPRHPHRSAKSSNSQSPRRSGSTAKAYKSTGYSSQDSRRSPTPPS